ncbi:hypothetical protein N657DRAFT_320752 [Parathielavia appendiculata]|uniref:Uncharacterized protein n=1 Tax=Parathielavia appendiculata TaxID=2587402 RepID=A0AAN6TRP6_9PEZI|nr:hypothetical protein N657DRAFT_320752 [Parathielavia appendiculata]
MELGDPYTLRPVGSFLDERTSLACRTGRRPPGTGRLRIRQYGPSSSRFLASSMLTAAAGFMSLRNRDQLGPVETVQTISPQLPMHFPRLYDGRTMVIPVLDVTSPIPRAKGAKGPTGANRMRADTLAAFGFDFCATGLRKLCGVSSTSSAEESAKRSMTATGSWLAVLVST